jgi:tryptophan halogenase
METLSSTKKIKNIIVVGGGTAGWLTALYAKKKFYDAEVTVVESKNIGILGAGEGSTPSLINFLDYINIPVSKIIKDADATIKNGIKFTNWNGDGSYYYHGFASDDEVGLSSFDNPEILPKTNLLHVVTSELGTPLSEVDFVEKIGEKNKVGFTLHPEYKDQVITDPIFKYIMHSNFSLHFNATKLASTLREIGEGRGVKVVEDEVKNIKQDKEGNISQLLLEKKDVLEVDFVFDCTGFHRLIIGNLYDAEWKSHEEKLPVNSAVPFFLPIEENIPSYTEAIAMNYGWIWKIPLQSRYGCGYVYDSSLISEEEAIKELEKYLGFEPEYPRKDKGGFKFNAGYYKTPWVKNCIAVGLSAGFIEPLEATSIWTSIISITNCMSNLNSLENIKEDIVKEFNEAFVEVNEEVVDFIHLHYLTKREDTEFWKKLKDSSKCSNFLKKSLDSQEYRVWDYKDFSKTIFPLGSWISVAEGLGLINKNVYKETYESNRVYDFISDSYEVFTKNQDDFVKKCINHKDFIKDLKL